MFELISDPSQVYHAIPAAARPRAPRQSRGLHVLGTHICYPHPVRVPTASLSCPGKHTRCSAPRLRPRWEVRRLGSYLARHGGTGLSRTKKNHTRLGSGLLECLILLCSRTQPVDAYHNHHTLSCPIPQHPTLVCRATPCHKRLTHAEKSMPMSKPPCAKHQSLYEQRNCNSTNGQHQRSFHQPSTTLLALSLALCNRTRTRTHAALDRLRLRRTRCARLRSRRGRR